MNNYALISVSNKSKIKNICKIFRKNKIKILATGTTAKYIKKIGYSCKEVSRVTGFKEMLDGRVKTLNPKIHGSLLFKRDNKEHVKSFKSLKFPEINFVIVNLYPFKNLKKRTDKMIEMIDIGGPTLLRSAAKNYKSVTTLTNINDYNKFIKELIKYNGTTSLEFRKKMALKVFKLTSNYDQKIFKSLLNANNEKIKKLNSFHNLRYGENPYQKAKFINQIKANFVNNIKVQHKEISYNNILDIDSAISLISEFKEPTCAIIKHNNPCGVGSDKNILNAFLKAYKSDPLSSFGGIIILNRKINEKIARQISKYFFEIIISKSFDKNALKIFNSNKNIIAIDSSKIKLQNKKEVHSALDGYLVQDKNNLKISIGKINCVSKRIATKKVIDDLIFALRVCKHVKSNSIVLAKNKKTIGIGAGQMSRVDATKIALMKLNKLNKGSKNFVAASDAFFPFNDSLEYLSKNGCTSVIQPKGSKNDNNAIKYLNKKNMSLYFVKERFFKH
tara:strand:- start:2946 stop:4454 length:1509 start_codon:yes stop_codon:yes gene_type:complete